MKKQKTDSMKMLRRYKGKREISFIFPRLKQKITGVLQHVNLWLQNKTNRLSSGKRKIALAFFCIAFITESLLVMYNNVKQTNSLYLLITPIHPMPLVKRPALKDELIKKRLQQIKAYRVEIDSLQHSSESYADSITFFQNRQHLMDTLNLLENLYHGYE